MLTVQGTTDTIGPVQLGAEHLQVEGFSKVVLEESIAMNLGNL